MPRIPLLAPVALLEDVLEHGLSRGEMGTVVEHLSAGAEEALLVEFADDHGQTYAMVDLKPGQVVVLHRGRRAA